MRRSPQALERRYVTKLADWRGLLTRNVADGRATSTALLAGPLRFTPLIDERRRATVRRGDRAGSAAGRRIGRSTHWVASPDGIRTLVSALKGPRPGPLDDGDMSAGALRRAQPADCSRAFEPFAKPAGPSERRQQRPPDRPERPRRPEQNQQQPEREEDRRRAVPRGVAVGLPRRRARPTCTSAIAPSMMTRCSTA